jgi:hypothetical protein
MPREATLPSRVVNVPGDYFSMAGFEVTLYGRFWVSTEVRNTKLCLAHRTLSTLGITCDRYSDHPSNSAAKVRRITQVTPNMRQNEARVELRSKINEPRETTLVIT